MSTVMYRKTTCLGCGFSQTNTLSLYKSKKAWNASHDLAKCAEMKKSLANAFSVYKLLA